jgi:hypothetical protein
MIDTAGARIQNTRPAAGIGGLTFSVFTIGLIHELNAASADIALLDDGTITCKELKHGVFEIITKGDHPQRFIVDDPCVSIHFQIVGSQVRVTEVANTPGQMSLFHDAFLSTFDSYLRGQQDPLVRQWQHANAEPQSTTTVGSSTPPNELHNVALLVNEGGGTPLAVNVSAVGPSGTTAGTVIVATNTTNNTLAPPLSGQPSTTPTTVAETVPASLTVNEHTATSLTGISASLTVNENTAVQLSGITVSDSPNTGDTLTTTLKVTNGTITVGTPSDVTSVTGNGGTTVTLTGTAAQITAALATTTYTGNLNYYGTDSLPVQTTDSTGGNSSASSTVPITITEATMVAETAPASLTVNEHTATSTSGISASLSGITVSDSPNTSDSLTMTLKVSNGTITIGTTSDVTSFTGNSTGTVTLTGTAAQIENALATTTYTSNLNVYGTDSLSVQTTDNTTGSSSGTTTVPITITEVPVIAAPTPPLARPSR